MPEPKVDTEAPEPGFREHDGSTQHFEVGLTTTVAAKLRNPLLGMSEADVLADVDKWVEAKGLEEHRGAFHKGGLIARVQHRQEGFEEISMLSQGEKQILRDEIVHKWRHPFMLYFLCVLCAGSAIVQGMDQSAVNGAQQFYFEEFGIEDEWLQGLLNGAPYLCSALIGCWTNSPLNKAFGRRGTIFISCFVSFAASIWMAVAHTTTPVYSAESTPKTIRGALTMQWQMWTAFGIMLGFVVSVAFQNITIPTWAAYANWRWMLASTAIPPFFVMIQVYMEKGRFDKAFESLRSLRFSEIQAARDMYYAAKLLEVEESQRSQRRGIFYEFFGIRRNRRAAQSAFFVMFMQQFCGVNVIAYYSSAIFEAANFPRSQALLVSLGTGAVNFLFAIPAIYTIDTFGRRNLLLTTFPLMSLCLFFTGFSFWIPRGPAQLACVATGIYLFMVVYSPGEGPVPFTYSAEAFPLYIRDTGMSFATATCWLFNFVISLTWPALQNAFTEQGAFSWYAAWNLFGFVYAYFLLPETKNLTLEELDAVFDVGNRMHAKYYTDKLPWYFKKHILRQDVAPFPELYQTQQEDEGFYHKSETCPSSEGVK
ncbi:hypothetical protein DL768_010946 [Monosporascus sp. mg162]|nr:hypothetical protein DL768_010946 [Monosporascus sp. mg162]